MNLQFKENEFIADLKNIIKINSINGDCGEKTAYAPLGEGINAAIEYFLKLGREFGFRTKNIDGYCGYIEFGEGDELLGIVVHADTVATGSGWDTNPLECIVKGGKLYGRGTSDNKGPALLALYCMKAVADSDIKLNKRVRLIIGGDEESGVWEGIKRYKKTEEIPTVSFSPDGEYPVVFGEKGMLKIKISATEKNAPKDFAFTGGNVINIVPEYAKARINGRNYEAFGKPAHGSKPEMGENAILKLGEILLSDGLDCMATKLITISNKKDLNIDISDNESGNLSINPSIFFANENYCEMNYDIRYPITAVGNEVIKNITESAEKHGFDTEVLYHEKPLYIPKNSHLVKTLSEIYKECTGDNREPLAMGGGTYAKAFPNCVAFGAMLPDDEETFHGPNEYWRIESVRKNFEIISEAIIRL